MKQLISLSRLREKKTKRFRYNSHVTEKFRKWYANGGKESLEKSMEQSDKLIRELREARKIDWSTIHQPMTI